MKYTKTSSGRMAVSAKMVLAASRSFTGRSPTLDPPKASPTTGFRRFLLVCRGLAQTQRRKGLVEARRRNTPNASERLEPRRGLITRKVAWHKGDQASD